MVMSPGEVEVIDRFLEMVRDENEGREVWSEKEVAVMLMWGLEREIKIREAKERRVLERAERREERRLIREAREETKRDEEAYMACRRRERR